MPEEEPEPDHSNGASGHGWELLERHPEKVLFYDFFPNPGGDKFGPTEQFAFRLADEAITHNIGINIHPDVW